MRVGIFGAGGGGVLVDLFYIDLWLFYRFWFYRSLLFWNVVLYSTSLSKQPIQRSVITRPPLGNRRKGGVWIPCAEEMEQTPRVNEMRPLRSFREGRYINQENAVSVECIYT